MSKTNHTKSWDRHTRGYSSYLKFERALADNTIKSYNRDVEQLREFIETEYDIPPSEIEASHIESFMASIYDRRMEATSQARILSGIRGFFNYLQLTGLIETSPVEFIDAPNTRRKLPDVLTVGEIDSIIDSIDLSEAQGHRNKAIIETLYSCGLRVSELTGLRLNDLFFDDDFIRVTGKGDKQRLVPLSHSAKHNISLWLEQRRAMKVDAKSADIVFLNRRGRKLTRVMIFTIVKQATEAAGIMKNVSPHSFRHSFATHLLEGGASIRQVQELLGHSSITTTEIYTHLDRSALRRSLEKHHPLED